LENALNLSLEQALIPVTSLVPNILIIDDNINIRQFLHQELSAHDYEVHEASSGAEGLAMVAQHKPDLIILDVKMPHLNGFEVAVRLHTNPVTLYIPVIFHTIAEDQLLGEKLGIDCYLTKPVKDSDLLDAVNKLLKKPRLRKKILLFIANSDKRHKWVNLLERCSFEVAAVENVPEGIESAVAFNPHLVIAEASLAKDFKIIHQLRLDRGLDRILFTLLDDA
jgi:CheY-like chemotaxis protein